MKGDLDDLRDTLAVSRSSPTLRHQALEKLRRAIIQGSIAPGSRLVERRLCELLTVSRTVVREILRQLEAEGWVVNPPYKGPTVTSIGPEDARQIYEIRCALEGMAAKLCAARASEDQIDRLEKIVAEMAGAARRRDVEKHIRLIEEFYEALMAGANNSMMSAYLASQRSRVSRLRSLSLSQPRRADVSVVEKKRLVAAIRARDENGARLLAEEHVRASAAVAFANIRGSEQQERPDRKTADSIEAPVVKRKGAVRMHSNAGRIPERGRHGT